MASVHAHLKPSGLEKAIAPPSQAPASVRGDRLGSPPAAGRAPRHERWHRARCACKGDAGAPINAVSHPTLTKRPAYIAVTRSAISTATPTARVTKMSRDMRNCPTLLSAVDNGPYRPGSWRRRATYPWLPHRSGGHDLIPGLREAAISRKTLAAHGAVRLEEHGCGSPAFLLSPSGQLFAIVRSHLEPKEGSTVDCSRDWHVM